MAGSNTTGLPNTSDYNLGRGVLYMADIDGTTGLPLEFRDLGNATEFNLNLTTEDLTHASSREGLRKTDKRFIIEQTMGMSFILDELNFENLAMFLSGEVTPGGIKNGTETAIDWQIDASSVPARWYDLFDGQNPLVRLYDLDLFGFAFNIVREFSGTPVVLVENDDYYIDYRMGRVFFLESGTLYTPGDDVGIDITTPAPADSTDPVDQVRGMTKGEISGAVKFVAENPGDNDVQTEYQFHKASVSADGDLALIGDEVTTMPFTGIAEINGQIDPSSPVWVRTTNKTFNQSNRA